MLLSMAKVEIIGPKSLFYDVVSSLHEIGTLHIEDLSKKIAPGAGLVRRMEVDTESLELRNSFGNQLVKVNAILSAVEPPEPVEVSPLAKAKAYNDIWREDAIDLQKEIDKFLGEVESKARDLATEKSGLELEVATLNQYEGIIDKIQPLVKEIVALEGFETVALLIQRKHKAVLDLIRKEMTRITRDQFEIVSSDVDEDTTAALIVFNKTFSEPVHAFLWAENVSQIRLPEDLAEEPFDIAVQKLRQKRLDIPKRLEKIREELRDVSNQFYIGLLAVKDVLADRMQQLESVNQFGQTDYTFVIEGWLPKRDVPKTQKALSEHFGERVMMNEIEVTEMDLHEAPVQLSNPKFAKPYEFIMTVFSPPKYGTVDPTMFVALFFPFLFGLIVGDIGYGLLFLAVALYFRYKYRTNEVVKSFLMIPFAASISCIVFGFLYGEFFGDIPEIYHWVTEVHIGGVTLPLNRIEAVVELMIISLAVGVAHLAIGSLLGVLNGWREKSNKHMMEGMGFFVMIMSLVGIVVTIVFADKVTVFKLLQVPTVVVLFIGIVLIVKGGGLIGGIHIISLFGAIGSYIRIMALGVAGVILAVVANKIAGQVGNIAIGILIATFLHAINIIVSGFSPTIHALRLNVVEFYGKFYEGGGKLYKPFRKAGGGQ